jgi:predicted Zn-ribbon and HTH transcriptional regulator
MAKTTEEREPTSLGIVKLDACKCERCGYTWLPRKSTKEKGGPIQCPHCKSAYWNRSKERLRKRAPKQKGFPK